MDANTADGRPGKFSDADERIYALLSLVEDQQTAVRAGIEGSTLERGAMATARVALVEQAGRMKGLNDKLVSAVAAAIPLMAKTAGEASRAALAETLRLSGEAAAKAAADATLPELAKFTAAVESAAAVQIQLGAAVKDFQRKWAWFVASAIAGLVLAAALVTYEAVWWQLRELGQLEAQRDKLTTEINALQAQAEQGRRNNGRKPAK